MKVHIGMVYAEEGSRRPQVGDALTITVRGVVSVVSADVVDVTSFGDKETKTTLGESSITILPVGRAMIT